jgi:glycerol-3-phosphate dehydrogenase
VHAAAGCIADDPRDGFIKMSRRRGEAPLLTVVGGATTGARQTRGTRALARLAHFFAVLAALDGDCIAARRRFRLRCFRRAGRRRAPSAGTFLGRATMQGGWLPLMARAIGSILGAAKSMDDLGPRFGHDLTGAEVRYLMKEEFARFADDILWRRSKLGLTMPRQDREALAAFMAAA